MSRLPDPSAKAETNLVGHVDPLPKFSNPPVVETVLGVHFRPIEGFNLARRGVLWDRCFRERFPEVEERAPVDETREVFGDELKAAGQIVRWQVSDRPPSPRLWASSEDGENILQIQRTALLANWLKTTDEASYRPYEQRRVDFRNDLRRVDEYLENEGIGRVIPTSCFVTYINHIECHEPCQLSPVLAQALTFWEHRTSDGWLPEPDKLNLQLAFPFPDEAGRLNVHIRPAVRRSDKRHLLRMDLTARATLAEREMSAAMNWFDLGHEWVVRGFASMTSEVMHERWGRDKHE